MQTMQIRIICQGWYRSLGWKSVICPMCGKSIENRLRTWRRQRETARAAGLRTTIAYRNGRCTTKAYCNGRCTIIAYCNGTLPTTTANFNGRCTAVAYCINLYEPIGQTNRYRQITSPSYWGDNTYRYATPQPNVRPIRVFNRLMSRVYILLVLWHALPTR